MCQVGGLAHLRDVALQQRSGSAWPTSTSKVCSIDNRSCQEMHGISWFVMVLVRHVFFRIHVNVACLCIIYHHNFHSQL